ncbi:splicing regulatory glutamine/lysine-rich protein 1-like [Gossypium australe]|uniref:Splicing regulatory glutamine/lysine-rich protein 1-like n=1 Tax=Gossypium australe TaxID=47621 RepID=A0A5B6WGR3_9ROSI|nr:splicing regulatory glutamine/lysine-rich protein 1-like [Gossypium australe]
MVIARLLGMEEDCFLMELTHGGTLKLEMYAGIRSIVSGCSLSGTLLLEDNSSGLAFGRHSCIGF